MGVEAEFVRRHAQHTVYTTLRDGHLLQYTQSKSLAESIPRLHALKGRAAVCKRVGIPGLAIHLTCTASRI
ncbi:hypothetical protein F751_2878 [Auxenochlorella protothecoides]|uniref:Uncharacterized protein n=1 Tax=Auxenochlorella protothecoides TaxID=3075 RepID=A0A087SD15_AUXPR|nr:hypothetical protein F751_2878 [Auxenochlorella protothecoides]KFM23619.1 hypothetical protein F751_2878 [Auxenochlorella protothecoides]